ncbi:MAG TPA: hypothetical protein VGX37_03135 [Allosphingosinicella sp.]|nr:hypothetical protein [Allosphingosinicella sp.]
MDMAFLRQAERMLARGAPARIDHSIFVAALAAQREALVTIRSQASLCAPADQGRPEDPLVELVLAGPAWRQALSAQRGCFSRVEAGRRRNES